MGKRNYRTLMLIVWIVGFSAPAYSVDSFESVLQQPILKPGQAFQQHVSYVRGRVPALQLPQDARQWQQQQQALRTQVLQQVIFRGVPSSWRQKNPAVVWLERIETDQGYALRKLRVEALPGLWIPGILYEPDDLQGRVPVVLNVNGHDRQGKVTAYKQLRCINLAKRGMLALNLEWLGMGQLNSPGYAHNDLAKLDLCGTSGVSVFFLAMSRGLDVLLAHPQADPKRVAVTGLSGGGWQTIVLSSLDQRVTLTVPVAGYSALTQRLAQANSIGDLEQNPTDLVQYADYSHLTAMMVPRPTLLIYNDKDNCCFVSSTVKPNTFDPVVPFFRQAGVIDRFQYYENSNPGTHNYDQDNREQLYRFLNHHFFRNELVSNKEIPSIAELRSKEDLHVELPGENATFSSLASQLAESLPRRADAGSPQRLLAKLLRLEPLVVDTAQAVKGPPHQLPWNVQRWRLVMDKHWTLPAVVIEGAQTTRTVLWLSDQPWSKHQQQIGELLQTGCRVICVDAVLFGHAKPPGSLYQNAQVMSTVGARPLGIQAAQIRAAVRFFTSRYQLENLDIRATGIRVGLASLCAKALGESLIGKLETPGLPTSLKSLLVPAAKFDQVPELYCFGLLEWFDLPELRALAR
ncbi:MAG: acetylxylan esterase [Pirellulaceae bacterium]